MQLLEQAIVKRKMQLNYFLYLGRLEYATSENRDEDATSETRHGNRFLSINAT